LEIAIQQLVISFVQSQKKEKDALYKIQPIKIPKMSKEFVRS
jgi:hypothetical protein